MLTLVSCPTCHHKFTIPEEAMEPAASCPNCQSLFVAGKSVAGAMAHQEQAFDVEPRAWRRQRTRRAIDRCSAKWIRRSNTTARAQEAAQRRSGERGRHRSHAPPAAVAQVPVTPPRSAVVDPLNKTLLASAGARTAARRSAVLARGAGRWRAPAATAALRKSRGWKPYAIGGAPPRSLPWRSVPHGQTPPMSSRKIPRQSAGRARQPEEGDERNRAAGAAAAVRAESRKQWQTLIEKQ